MRCQIWQWSTRQADEDEPSYHRNKSCEWIIIRGATCSGTGGSNCSIVKGELVGKKSMLSWILLIQLCTTQHNELAEFKNLGQQLSAKVPDFDDLKVLRTLIKKKYGVVIDSILMVEFI